MSRGSAMSGDNGARAERCNLEITALLCGRYYPDADPALSIPMKRHSQLKRSGFKRRTVEELKSACYPLAPTRRRMKQASFRLNRAPREADQMWARAVKERDNHTCQWPMCGFCRNVPSPHCNAHHKALRSARPDLRHDLDNGVTVCGQRHSWIHSSEGREEAIAAGFLDLTSYELAMSTARGGQE